MLQSFIVGPCDGLWAGVISKGHIGSLGHQSDASKHLTKKGFKSLHMRKKGCKSCGKILLDSV